jgi:uncharacterized membrane protein (DUF106 family)
MLKVVVNCALNVSMILKIKQIKNLNNFMKRIIIILGLVFSMVAVDAKPQKGPKGKGKALKERFEAAKKKRDAHRDSAKKPKGGPDFRKWRGKRIESEELNELRAKMRELTKELHELRKKHAAEMKKRMSEIKKEFANKRDKVIDGNKPGE